MAYVTLEAFKAYKGIPAATVVDDTLLRDLLERVSKRFDIETGRRFHAYANTRYYESDAVNGTTLYLDDDLISIDTNGLTNGDSSGTTIAGTNYWLLPRNGGPPYYAIRLKTDCDYSWEFDTDYWVSVAGQWGFMEVPSADIEKAITEWAAYCYDAKDIPGTQDINIFPDSGTIMIPRGIPYDVQKVIDSYRRRVG